MNKEKALTNEQKEEIQNIINIVLKEEIHKLAVKEFENSLKKNEHRNTNQRK